MKPCPEYEPLLRARAEGDISPVDDARLSQHLPFCKACRAEERATRAALEWVTLPPVSAAELTALDGLAEGARADLRRSEHRRIWLRGAMAGVLAAAAAAVIVLWPHPAPRSELGVESPASSGEAAAEVESWALSDPLAETLAEAPEAQPTAEEEHEPVVLDPQTKVDLYLNPGE